MGDWSQYSRYDVKRPVLRSRLRTTLPESETNGLMPGRLKQRYSLNRKEAWSASTTTGETSSTRDFVPSKSFFVPVTNWSSEYVSISSVNVADSSKRDRVKSAVARNCLSTTSVVTCGAVGQPAGASKPNDAPT